MKDKVSIYDHMNVFNLLANKLLGTSIKIDEEEEPSIFLCSMPDLWDNLIMSLSLVTKLHMNSITTPLLSKETKKMSLELSTSTSSSQALVSEEGRRRLRSKFTNRRDKGRGKSKSRKDLKCPYLTRWFT